MSGTDEVRPSTSSAPDNLDPSSNQTAGRVCARHISSSPPRQRDVDIVYTDIFLDAFNYVRDWQYLWNDVLEFNADGDQRQALIVLSQPLYEITLRNENSVVLRNGRCFITTPKTFHRIGDVEHPPPPHFDAVLYFNTDPFTLAGATTGPAADVTTIPSLVGAGVVKTPFTCTFDNYMTNNTTTNISIVFSVFLMRTDAVSEYEHSRGVRVNFTQRILPVHSYGRDILCTTACNYCSDFVLYMEHMTEAYTVRPDQQISTLLRALGPAVAETLFQPNRLALLDMSADRGGRTATAEYYRMKQFYYSFAHGKRNKWGLKLAADVSTKTHLRRWNALLCEEMRRWVWVFRHGMDTLPPDSRPTEDMLRETLTQFYNTSPCILNAVNVDIDVLRRQPTRPLPTNTASTSTTTTSTGDNTNAENYIRDVLMNDYDTSTLAPGGDLNSKTISDALLAGEVSINNELVVTNTWPSSTLLTRHDRFFTSMIT